MGEELLEKVEKVTKEELQNVLNTMIRYSRTSGYMTKIEGKLTFFDGQPFDENNVGGASVTKDELIEWVTQYESK